MTQTFPAGTGKLPAKYRNRPHWLRILSWWTEAGFVRTLWLLTGSMDPARAATLGRRLFRWLGPRSAKQPFVDRNLRVAFPGLTPVQYEQLAHKVWENFGAVLAEYPHLRSFRMTDSAPAIEVEMDPATRVILDARQPAVYVSAHLGNWELAAAAITAAGIPLSVVYAPQGNPLLDRLLQKVRLALGCKFIAKKNALRRLAREIRAGRSVGILPDQRVDTGEPIAFFGHSALTTTSPAWLAIKMHCPLVPVQITRTGDARYRAVFHPPLQPHAGSDQRAEVLQLTAAINDLFENWIRREPGQWLCMRRRWSACTPETKAPVSG
jgi:KDO2-lipid IV(A) lauroyltransferase